jgi:hypothetical protein
LYDPGPGVVGLPFEGDLELLPNLTLGVDYLILSRLSKVYYPGPGTPAFFIGDALKRPS